MIIKHADLEPEALRSLIRKGKIGFGGNRKLKIYGLLSCRSGKRLNKENRVFFVSEQEAVQHGFRPCGHCMKDAYKQWKFRNGQK
jgi:methylphosphotriester-DNA--protein-cysteine methyltransferase